MSCAALGMMTVAVSAAADQGGSANPNAKGAAGVSGSANAGNGNPGNPSSGNANSGGAGRGSATPGNPNAGKGPPGGSKSKTRDSRKAGDRGNSSPRGSSKSEDRSAKAERKADNARGKGEARRNGDADREGSKLPNAQGRGPSGKTTICHATDSASNPYVTITVSNNALPAHRRHQDGEDIIPAPATGCPGGLAKVGKPTTDQQPKGVDGKGKKDHGKTTICHATGSTTNPYVKITISNSALPAHRRHQNGEDIIPAPQGECPTSTTVGVPTETGAATPVAPASGSSAPAGSAPAATGSTPSSLPAAGQPASPSTGVLGTSRESANPAASARDAGIEQSRAPVAAAVPKGDVLGENASSSAENDERSGPAGLPFTGLQLLLIVAAGLGLVLAGLGVRALALRRG